LVPLFIAACGIPGWTVVVENSDDKPYVVRLTVDGEVSDHRIGVGSNSAEAIYYSANVPNEVFAEVLDLVTCETLFRFASPLPRQHVFMRIGFDNDGVVSVNDDPWWSDNNVPPNPLPAEPCIPSGSN
jgi:hypothetical protein